MLTSQKSPSQGKVVALDDDGEGDFDVQAAYRSFGREIFGFAVNSVGDRAVAEDCVQETFLRAWSAKGRFRRGLGTERTWLFAIARNVVIDTLRARSRRPRPVGDDRIERSTASTETEAALVERLTLYQALAGLTPEHREVIAAVQLEGLSYQQLADRCGIGVPTLRTRMFYGLRALRARLEEEDHRE